MKVPIEIDELIGKFLAGEASPEEAIRLEDWLKESKENEVHFNAMANVFGLEQSSISVENAWKKVSGQLTQTPIRKLRFGWVSSVAAILIIAIGAFFWMNSNSESQIYTSENGKRNVKLTDGTDIQLAAHSSVELSEEYGTKNRFLNLKGSAYFSVKHSKQLPFVINTGPIHIKDLGTKFDVKSTGDTIFVRVDEGVVMIYDNKGMKVTLKANESARYVISSGKLELDVTTGSFSPKNVTVLLDDQRLEDAVKILNQSYKVDIRIENPAINNCRITTEFLNEELETVLDVIAQTLEVRIEKIGDIYWIKGSSCSQ